MEMDTVSFEQETPVIIARWEKCVHVECVDWKFTPWSCATDKGRNVFSAPIEEPNLSQL